MTCKLPQCFPTSLESNFLDSYETINNLTEKFQNNTCPTNYIPAMNTDPNLQNITDGLGTYYLQPMGGSTVKAPGLVGWPVIITTPSGDPNFSSNGIITKHTTLGNIPGGGKYPGNAGVVPDGITVNNLSKTIPSLLDPTHPYYYCVKPPPPTPLNSIIISKQSATGFTAKWSGGNNATSYTYSLNTTEVIPSIDDGISNNTATFTGLVGGKVYELIIKAININGTQTGTSSIILPAPPSELTNFIFSKESATGFTFTWAGGQSATSYTYTLNGSITNPKEDNGISSNSATFSGLTTGQKYDIILTAINANGSTTGNTSITLQLPTSESKYGINNSQDGIFGSSPVFSIIVLIIILLLLGVGVYFMMQQNVDKNV
jgi:hypothetical protein